jgi:hypothetical protein
MKNCQGAGRIMKKGRVSCNEESARESQLPQALQMWRNWFFISPTATLFIRAMSLRAISFGARRAAAHPATKISA